MSYILYNIFMQSFLSLYEFLKTSVLTLVLKCAFQSNDIYIDKNLKKKDDKKCLIYFVRNLY